MSRFAVGDVTLLPKTLQEQHLQQALLIVKLDEDTIRDVDENGNGVYDAGER